MTMLVSPTEPAELRALGVTSWVPEQYGADYLFTAAGDTLVAVQRKTVPDLLNSMRGDRLAREIPLLRTAHHPMLLVEGEPLWTDDGLLIADDRSRWSVAGWWGFVLSLQVKHGISVVIIENIDRTASWLLYAQEWFYRERHDALLIRPKPADEFGNIAPRDFAIHLLQSIPGIGPSTAASIYDHVGMPLRLYVDEARLRAIPNVGRERARKIVKAFSHFPQAPQQPQTQDDDQDGDGDDP